MAAAHCRENWASLEKDLKFKSERIVALDESNRNLTAKVVEVQKQRDEMKDGFNKENNHLCFRWTWIEKFMHGKCSS